MPPSACEEALALQREGRLDEAAERYETALRDDDQNAAILLQLGVLRISQGRISEAEKLLHGALSIEPNSGEAHAHLATALQFSGRYGEAIHHFEAALVCDPTLTQAIFGLAACLQALGRNEQAIDRYGQLLAADPAHAEANYGLATLLAALGENQKAIEHYRIALATDVDFVEAQVGLGALLERTGDVHGAVDCFRATLEIDPEYDDVRLALAKIFQRLERDDELIACYRIHLERHPRHAPTHFDLAAALSRKGRLEEAATHYETAFSLEPESAACMIGLASTLRRLDRNTEVVPLCRRAIALEPHNVDALSLLGRALVDAGDLNEGLALSRRAFEVSRERPGIAYNFVMSGKVQPGDAVVPALEALVPRAPSLSPSDQCFLYFALAKAYQDIGQPADAFKSLLIGNSIKRRHVEYDESKETGFLGRIERLFTADMLQQRRGLGYRSKVPIFIVGMPRSGTTLVEQILASHPAVHGAGERPELPRLLARIAKSGQHLAPYPEVLGLLSGSELCKLGKDYVDALLPLAPNAAAIVDKHPPNFLWVGLIHVMLPDARIIHVMRDPMDTCLSCFSHLFAGPLNFAYDLSDLGRYYTAYRRLMAHWRSVLPKGAMHEIQYESLVANFPEEARRLVDHCDLGWDPACLDFYKTNRTVQTASVTQVRQPIYTTSIGRWRPPEELLRPLLDALGAEAISLPQTA